MAAIQHALNEFPDELWLKIFLLVANDHDANTLSSIPWDEAGPQQAALFKLPLVCKKFYQVFSGHYSKASQNLLLGPKIPTDGHPQVLAWVHKCKNLVRLEANNNTHVAEMVLAKLCYASGLRIADFADMSAVMLQTLPTFRHLRTCRLSAASMSSEVDLTPLQGLTCVESLTLEAGNFNHFPVLLSLRSISFLHAEVEACQTCIFNSLLHSLYLQDSAVNELHADGLVACVNLQDLSCENSSIYCMVAQSSLLTADNANSNVPSCLSALSCLTSLSITLGELHSGTAVNEQTLSCLFGLTSLHALALRFYCHAAVPTAITRLSRLTALTIKGVESETACVPISVGFHADCARFSQLQELYLGHMVIQFAYNVLGLTTIRSLSQVSLCQLQCQNSLSTKCLCALLCMLSRHHPAVKVYLDDDDDESASTLYEQYVQDSLAAE